ncbi:ECF-type sigma factor [Tahibacter sp. UC22_41]|uniref:ECF-type sigma factor n=1 Tax=Tahibacter sp. UC22_41 TaxID=3350178 RepID=UPI002CEBD280|nr:ECF-type sigma factor [Tahibacter sp.]
MSTDLEELTGLLNLALAGDVAASERAFALVYAEMRRCAQRQMRGQNDALTLSPTVLVNEAYLKLSAGAARSLNDRGHFYSLAARAMRQVLLDHQRASQVIKRGGGVAHVELTDKLFDAEGEALDYFALEQALSALRQIDARAATVVDWHFFAGLNFIQIADLLQVSDKTARRDWDSARAFLLMQLSAR